MHELRDKAKEILMVKQKHTFRPGGSKNTATRVLLSGQTTLKEIPIFNNIEKDGQGAEIMENEETVLAVPDQIKKVNKSHRLIVLSGDSIDKTYLLNRPKMMIGRDPSSHICICEKTVSLFHAMICIEANECILKDLNSKNGTIVNGSRIKDSIKLKDGDKIEIGCTIFTFILGGLGHSYRARKLLWKKRYTLAVFAMISIIVAVFISLNQIKAGDSRSGSSNQQKNLVANNSSGEKKLTNSNEAGITQKKLPSDNEKSLTLDEKGLQLTEKALHLYINGNIALSLSMLEETLQLNLPNDSALKAKALAIKDKVVKIYTLYKEGLTHYNESNMGQAFANWSQALKADKEIVGQTNSYFANQIAGHTSDIFYRMAQEALNRGNNEKAQEFCSQTFRALPGHKGCIAIMNML